MDLNHPHDGRLPRAKPVGEILNEIFDAWDADAERRERVRDATETFLKNAQT